MSLQSWWMKIPLPKASLARTCLAAGLVISFSLVLFFQFYHFSPLLKRASVSRYMPSLTPQSQSSIYAPSKSSVTPQVRQAVMIFGDYVANNSLLYEDLVSTHIRHGEKWNYPTHILRYPLVGKVWEEFVSRCAISVNQNSFEAYCCVDSCGESLPTSSPL